jgi:hypothetical protein
VNRVPRAPLTQEIFSGAFRGDLPLHIKAAVHVDLLTGDVIALADEEGDCLGNLLRLCETMHRDPGFQLGLYIPWNRGNHVSAGEAGSYGVDGDVVFRNLQGQRLCLRRNLPDRSYPPAQRRKRC